MVRIYSGAITYLKPLIKLMHKMTFFSVSKHVTESQNVEEREARFALLTMVALLYPNINKLRGADNKM